MTRSTFRVLAVMFFALLLCLNAVIVSARVAITPTYDISKIDWLVDKNSSLSELSVLIHLFSTVPGAVMQVACGKILTKRSQNVCLTVYLLCTALF